MPKIDLEKLLCEGENIKQQEHDAIEKEKHGQLRAGNTGIVTEEGDILGSCHRLTLARYLGYQPPNRPVSQFFFHGGEANEHVYYELLRRSWVKKRGMRLKMEPHTHVQWTLRMEVPPEEGKKRGKKVEVPVTGRPDFLLQDEDENTLMVIENKGIQSAMRAKKALIAGQPASDALCQNAHYCWQLDAPGVVTYAAYSSFYKIQPGRIHFYTGFDQEGRFYFIDKNGNQVKTEITAEAIKRFYELIYMMTVLQKLGPMYSPKPVYQCDDDDYNKCKSCPLREACERYNDDYMSWLDAVKIICTGGSI
jgi:hypothetical protein